MARSVIAAMSLSPRLYIQFMSWRARNGLLPSPPTNASSSAFGRPNKLVRSMAATAVIGSGHPRGQSSVVRKKYAISIAAFSAESEPCTVFASMLSARSARMVPGAAFFGSVAPMIFAILRDGVFTFEHLHEHRTRGHVLHEVLEERARGVHGVETFGVALRQMHHARGDDLEADLFEAADDLADEVTGNAVGLDDGQSALERHAKDSLWGS